MECRVLHEFGEHRVFNDPSVFCFNENRLLQIPSRLISDFSHIVIVELLIVIQIFV